MCIVKKEQWVYDGKSYDEEIDAVKAALTHLGTRFVKEFHGKPLEGMLALGGEVTPLRDRYLTLLDLELHPEEGTSEKVAGEPKAHPLGYAGGDPDDLLSTNSMTTRYLAVPSHSPIAKAVRQWLDREGYRHFADATQNLTGSKRQELSNLIGIAKEPEQ